MKKEELIRLLKDSFGENKLDLRAFQYDFPQEEFNNKMEKLNKAEEQIVALIKKPEVDEAWLPTAENINALPEPVRKYIHDIETNTDPAHIVRENILIKDTCKKTELIDVFLKSGVNLVGKVPDEIMPTKKDK